MNEHEVEDLERPENWDYKHAERRPGVRKTRTVLSVAFPRDDFELISQYAQGLGMKVSEFVRKAALEKASARANVAMLEWMGGTSGSFAVSVALGPTTSALSEVSLDQGEPKTLVA